MLVTEFVNIEIERRDLRDLAKDLLRVAEAHGAGEARDS